MDAAGFDRFELSPEDQASFRTMSLDAAWAVIAENAGDEIAAELKTMLVD